MSGLGVTARSASAFAPWMSALLACSPVEFVFVGDDAGTLAASSSSSGSDGGAASSTGSAAGGGGAGASGGAPSGSGGAEPSCVTQGPFQTITFDSNTFGWQGMLNAAGISGYQYLEANCNPAAPGSTTRGFMSFASDALPDGAAVVGARMRLCGISFGGPGHATVFDVSFALPLDAPDYAVAAIDLGTEVPAVFGQSWFDIPPSSVNLDVPSQYSLRQVDETCPTGSTYARYATDGDHPAESCPAPSPPLLEITFCEP